MTERTEVITACSNPKCELPGAWRPVLVVWPVGSVPSETVPARITFEEAMCDRCRKLTTREAFIKDLDWADVVKIFEESGDPTPSIDTARVEFARVEGVLH